MHGPPVLDRVHGHFSLISPSPPPAAKKKNRKKEGEMKNKHYANKLNSIPQYYSFSDKLDEKA